MEIATADPGDYEATSVHHAHSASTAIRADAPLVTVINVFTTQSEHQERLLELLQAATEPISRLRGFVSANFHRARRQAQLGIRTFVRILPMVLLMDGPPAVTSR
ncbi:MAG: antibiotic biosynthesis monooxygenase [Egibacteraceae bacterium]